MILRNDNTLENWQYMFNIYIWTKSLLVTYYSFSSFLIFFSVSFQHSLHYSCNTFQLSNFQCKCFLFVNLTNFIKGFTFKRAWGYFFNQWAFHLSFCRAWGYFLIHELFFGPFVGPCHWVRTKDYAFTWVYKTWILKGAWTLTFKCQESAKLQWKAAHIGLF